jgi:DNA-3-methyladenine glycosylase I
LLNNKKIIRNKLKIYSIVYNAKVILKIQNDHKSFKSWLDKKKCKNINQWVKLFKKKFKFIGIKITEEFLLSSGYIEGAHNKECKIYNEILKSNPNWLKK